MFVVIIDTLEKEPWSLNTAFAQEVVDSVVRQHIPTADYSVVGLEDKLVIERKKSVAEIAQNITTERFNNELERMSKFPHAYLILEFGLDDINSYPIGSTVPKKLWHKIKVTGGYIRSRLAYYSVVYGIHVIYAGDRDNAEQCAVEIMKKVYAKYAKSSDNSN